MGLYELIRNRKEKISIIGLGYVGLPLAISFAKKAEVIGFDIAKSKVEKYLSGFDVTKEVGDEAIQQTTAFFTWEEKYLREAKFHIVAVRFDFLEEAESAKCSSCSHLNLIAYIQ